MALSVVELNELHEQLDTWRKQGLSIGFVPTMGGLHEGHCSLMRQAKTLCDRLVVSIYVNPTQFAPHEDLNEYPRDAQGDQKSQAAGADLVWLAQHRDIYPPNWSTTIVPQGARLGLETDHRPHFFTGVATVVARLFSLIRPDVAVFGEKDYQQLLVVRQLNDDLRLGVEIVGGRLVRDEDGLALSSRNVYLEPAARAQARVVPKALQVMCKAYANGERDASALAAHGEALLTQEGLIIDYCRIVSSADLKAPTQVLDDSPQSWRALIAARCHGIRLLDNCALDDPPWR
jgi:pantoate--beta-alanine ligase